MTIFIWILIIIVALIILLLSITLFQVVKKATYLSRKEKDIVIFAIDMYVEYGEEIEITSKDKHEIIVNELNKVKNKIG